MKTDTDSDTSTPTNDCTDKMIIDFSSDNEESDNDPQTPSEPHQVRRSTRERKPPDCFGREQTNLQKVLCQQKMSILCAN